MSKPTVQFGFFMQVPFNRTDIADEQDLMDKFAHDVQNWMRWQAGHVWNFDVRGFVMPSEASPYPPGFATDDIKQFIANNPAMFADVGFMPEYLFVVSGSSKRACGHAFLGGKTGAVYGLYNCGARTGIHEAFGHAFGGLNHASTLTNEYGEKTIMGGAGSTAITRMNTPHRLQMGLETVREILYVEHSQPVLLAPPDLNQHALYEMERQVAVMRKPGSSTSYFASIPKALGGKYIPSFKYADELHIHSQTNKNNTYLIHVLRPEQHAYFGGFKLEYLEYSNETARGKIWVPWEEEQELPDLPMPVGLPKMLSGMVATEAHSGNWFNPDFPKQGLDLRIRDGKAILYYFTYNQTRDDRRFYTAYSENVDGGQIDFDLYTSIGGTVANPSSSVSTKIGTASIAFFDGTHGIFSYETTEHGRQAIEIVPTILDTNPLSGSFYQPDRRGEGFCLQFVRCPNEQGKVVDMCAGRWFGFGARDQSHPALKYITNQRWYQCEGEKQGDGTYALTVYEFRDGEWMSFDEPLTHNVGHAVLTVVNNNELEFDFYLTAAGASQFGTYNLKRLGE